jgi:peptidyl-prolyl cis-trans isomerase SurA
MKIKVFIGILILFIIVFNNKSFAKIESNIVIKIENEIITYFEIKNKILSTLLLTNQEINQESINNQKKRALDLLIQHKLKKIELAKYKIPNDIKQVNNYLRSISSNNIDKLKEEFKKNDLDFQLFLEEVETKLKWQKLIYSIYTKKIEIDESLIDLELNNSIKNKSSINEFEISEIEILKTDNKETNKNKISFIKSKIQEIGFENTAIQYSASSSSTNKGNIGWITSKTLSKEIFNIISKLKIGEVSDIIKRQNSYLILKLNDKKTSVIKNIDMLTLKANLINAKKNEMFELYSRSHLSKLKNNILIEYK